MKYLILLIVVALVAVGSWLFIDHYNKQLLEINARADSLQAEINVQRVKADSIKSLVDSISNKADSLEEAYWSDIGELEEENEEAREEIDQLSQEIVNMIPDSILRQEIEVRLAIQQRIYQERMDRLEQSLNAANNLITERNAEIRARIKQSDIDSITIEDQDQLIIDLRKQLKPKSLWGSFKSDVKGNAIKVAGTLVIYEGLKALIGG